MDACTGFCYNAFMVLKIFTNNKEHLIAAQPGENLLSLLQRNGFSIEASCGGKGTCGKCKVKLLEGSVSAAIADGYFNACRHTVDTDISIALESPKGAFSFFYQTPQKTKKQTGYGIAVDIGTTSLAVYLTDLFSGAIIDTQAELNRQISFGADIVSRMSAAKSGKLQLLRNAIREQISEISLLLRKRNGIDNIKKTVICGNNIMLHLYAGADPSGMGQAPFQPVFTKTQYENDTVLLPSASAYIGSDAIAGVLSSGMWQQDNCLLIDIGTNCEIILKRNGKYFACAAAAGPAFEGGNIEMGMGGVEGAIDHIYYNYNKLSYSTVSGTAKGICGSGLTDLMAILTQYNIIDRSGLLREIDSPLSKNIFEDKFFITQDVYITQKDIREFQLAKSAVRSGINILMKNAGCDSAAISTVYLAGGLGYYINIDSATKIGLLPQEFSSKTKSVGNAGGKGAVMCLVNEDNLNICQKIADKISVVDLNEQPDFFSEFVDNMIF